MAISPPLLFSWRRSQFASPAHLSPQLKEGTGFLRALFFLNVQFLTYSSRNPFFHAGLAKKLRRFFRRSWIDVEARAPFKSRSLGQLRHKLHVPVVVIIGRILRRRCVNHKI